MFAGPTGSKVAAGGGVAMLAAVVALFFQIQGVADDRNDEFRFEVSEIYEERLETARADCLDRLEALEAQVELLLEKCAAIEDED
jgi:hypothetical protein